MPDPFTLASKSTARRRARTAANGYASGPHHRNGANLDAAAPESNECVHHGMHLLMPPQVTTSDMGKLHQRPITGCATLAGPTRQTKIGGDIVASTCGHQHRAAPNEPRLQRACPKPPAIGRVQLEFDLPNRPIPTPRPGQIAKVPDRAGLVENARRSQNLALGVHRALRAS